MSRLHSQVIAAHPAQGSLTLRVVLILYPEVMWQPHAGLLMRAASSATGKTLLLHLGNGGHILSHFFSY